MKRVLVFSALGVGFLALAGFALVSIGLLVVLDADPTPGGREQRPRGLRGLERLFALADALEERTTLDERIEEAWYRGLDAWVALRRLSFFIRADDLPKLPAARLCAAMALKRLIASLPIESLEQEREAIRNATVQAEACRDTPSAPCLTAATLDAWCAGWDAWGLNLARIGSFATEAYAVATSAVCSKLNVVVHLLGFRSAPTAVVLDAQAEAATALDHLIEILPAEEAEALASARLQAEACRGAPGAPALTKQDLEAWASGWGAWRPRVQGDE